MSATIGALRVILGLDSAQFEGGLTAAQKHLQKVGRQFERIGGQMSSLGQSLTLGLTAPLAAFGASALKASADFEAAMVRVSISTKAGAKDMAAMEAAARQIGKSTVFSATEAADAMDMLAKTGLDATTILNGAAKAAVDLAAAAGSELEPAASAISDSLQQFKLSAAQLPAVVNQITGAVNESKLDFADFTLAIGQAGGVAAGLGVSFEDFNAVLAGTSSLFASGSDAGTSFKTFLTTLVPKTKEAAGLMREYGLDFFEANGQMKSMADIAQMLQERLGGLSNEAKTNVLKEIFGTDAMRTAIGLMDQGAAGLNRIKTAIAETDAAAQSAKRMEGFAGQMEQLRGSFEDLGIAIGKSGLLEFMTRLVSGLSNLLDRASEMNPELLKFGTIAAALAAAIGPLVMIAGGAVSAFGTLVGILSAPITLPIVAAVAGVAAAFAVFGDTLIPALKAFGATIQETVGPKIAPLFKALGDLVRALGEAFGQQFGEGSEAAVALRVLGEVVARVFGASLDIITGAVQVITHVIEGLAALFRGDFSGALQHLQGAALAAVGGISKAFATLFPEVLAWVEATVKGVKDWFGSRLTAIFDGVRAKVKAVGDAFFELYDRVVGHSYVPDMVDGVARWMAKLDAGMVKPARSATGKTAEAFQELRDEVAGIFDGLLTDSERQVRDYERTVLKLREAVKAGIIDVKALDDALARLNAPTERAARIKLFDDEGLKDVAAEANKVWEDAAEEREAVWTDSLKTMGDTFTGFFQGWIANGKADWKRLLLDLTRDWQSTMGVLSRMGGGLGAALSKGFSAISAALPGASAGMAIGQSMGFGTGNGGVDTALSIGGAALGGMFASSTLGTSIAAGLANGVIGLGGSVGLASAVGSGAAALLSSAAVLGPIAAIAALAIGSLFKKKPSNNGALATFSGDSFTLSGNKRTDQTSQMATAAANAILQGQKILTDAGIQLAATVKSIDIGTRDATDIILSDGRALTSAVGDAAAAAETALKALLNGATYASDQQKSLVESMVAAGKGFDDIAAALGGLSQAQAIPQAIAQAILAYSDPKGAAVAELEKAQKARRAEYEALADQGFLTAEQLASINEQLATLEGLELDDVLKRFADAAGNAWDQVAEARAAVAEAHARESDALEDFIARMRNLSAKLEDFGRSLRTGPLAMLSPEERYKAAKAEFERVRGLAASGDEAAAADLQAASQAFLEASRDYNATSPAYFADLAQVRAAVSATASLTEGLASNAEAELEAINKLVDGQIEQTKATQALVQTLENLGAALTGLEAFTGQKLGANPSVNAALAAATGFKGDFGSGGFQAWIVNQNEETRKRARDVLTAFGQDWRISGFATGGSFEVGGYGGPDSQLLGMRLSPGEMVNVRRPGDLGDRDVIRALGLVERRVAAVETLTAAGNRQRGEYASRDLAQGAQALDEQRAAKRAARSAAAR